MEWSPPGYTELRQLGRGGSGRVVLAVHDATGVRVAIKYVSERLRHDRAVLARFRSEARLLVALRDPNIATIWEYVEDTGGACIVMELVNGVSLRALLRENGPAEPEAALAVLKGSLLGLAKAHELGLVHRDYKPENVLVRDDGVSKLVDFGIAVRQGTTATPAGTPPYMAPELWSREPATPSTDVYAATAVFFECLTGHRPYRSSEPSVLGYQHLHAPVPIGDAPEPLRELVRSGLAKDPAQRPGSALAFLAELESAAVAAYGEDWEERGRRRLAALVALLAPLLLPLRPDTTPPVPETSTSLARTVLRDIGSHARRLTRSGARRVTRSGARRVVMGGALATAAAVTAVMVVLAANQPAPDPLGAAAAVPPSPTVPISDPATLSTTTPDPNPSAVDDPDPGNTAPSDPGDPDSPPPGNPDAGNSDPGGSNTGNPNPGGQDGPGSSGTDHPSTPKPGDPDNQGPGRPGTDGQGTPDTDDPGSGEPDGPPDPDPDTGEPGNPAPGEPSGEGPGGVAVLVAQVGPVTVNADRVASARVTLRTSGTGPVTVTATWRAPGTDEVVRRLPLRGATGYTRTLTWPMGARVCRGPVTLTAVTDPAAPGGPARASAPVPPCPTRVTGLDVRLTAPGQAAAAAVRTAPTATATVRVTASGPGEIPVRAGLAIDGKEAATRATTLSGRTSYTERFAFPVLARACGAMLSVRVSAGGRTATARTRVPCPPQVRQVSIVRAGVVRGLSAQVRVTAADTRPVRLTVRFTSGRLADTRTVTLSGETSYVTTLSAPLRLPCGTKWSMTAATTPAAAGGADSRTGTTPACHDDPPQKPTDPPTKKPADDPPQTEDTQKKFTDESQEAPEKSPDTTRTSPEPAGSRAPQDS
ncbi:Serine/threonine protein kinase [Nonomuraea maritima]|uniref:non-specific serine/threonine protein kinase n=1 Tax=Nonomuraea maritima TaxID=683260 RepID=A0A1G8UZV5_9ACTN|nr:serine/threonine-protein kinase [Nonomuraea maritima]SDJ59134.1 Serine/threonine protein kinase [Nonomuraea maritima]